MKKHLSIEKHQFLTQVDVNVKEQDRLYDDEKKGLNNAKSAYLRN